MKLLLVLKEAEVDLLRAAVEDVHGWFAQAKAKGAWQEELNELARQVERLTVALFPPEPNLSAAEAHGAARALEAAAQRCDTESFKQEFGPELAQSRRDELLALADKLGRFLELWA